MARRRIGQEQLAVGGVEARAGTSLDEVAALVDWTELDRLLGGISAQSRVSGRCAPDRTSVQIT